MSIGLATKGVIAQVSGVVIISGSYDIDIDIEDNDVDVEIDDYDIDISTDDVDLEVEVE